MGQGGGGGGGAGADLQPTPHDMPPSPGHASPGRGSPARSGGTLFERRLAEEESEADAQYRDRIRQMGRELEDTRTGLVDATRRLRSLERINHDLETRLVKEARRSNKLDSDKVRHINGGRVWMRLGALCLGPYQVFRWTTHIHTHTHPYSSIPMHVSRLFTLRCLCYLVVLSSVLARACSRCLWRLCCLRLYISSMCP